MPRVGSESMSTRGFCSSQRAISDFCWLPPLNSRIFCPNDGVLMARRLT